MAPDQAKRKLTTILSADVQGYSRLMGVDEEGTIRTLKVHLEVISGFIQQHCGRVFATGGDSILAEFGSVVDAVRCAVGIQGELKERNKELAEDRRLEFRIGINLGDVVEEGDTILGDGVNIAARVQSLAEAGGICITGTIYDHIKNKLAFGYAYMGEQTVKNITDPVRVYRVRMDPEAASSQAIEEKKPRRKGLSRAVLAGIALVVIAGAVVLYQFTLRPSTPRMEVASKEKMAFPLPDKPSIAVLPFVNMSGDPKQEFFSDGITEEITTALSKVHNLFVISRQSSFSYKGKPVKVKQVSEELGVRYVLEGSVQKSENRFRINAQLIDALTGRHLWAERYERDLKDLFALQDEIAIKILTAIRVKLTEGEQVSGFEKYYKGQRGLDCYLKYLEWGPFIARANIKDTVVARRLAEETMEMCPESPLSYTFMCTVHWLEYFFGMGKSPQDSIEQGIEMAQKALAMDNSLALGHMFLGQFYLMKREHEKAIAETERALALDPGGSNAHLAYGQVLRYVGRPEEAIPVLQKAIRLNPLGDVTGFQQLGYAYRDRGRFEEAVSAYRKAIQRAPDNFFAHIGLVATYSMMGREEEARFEVAEVLRVNPRFSVDSYAKRLPYKDQSALDKSLDALRKAGLK
jgi:adenylate cyclase